MASDSILDPAFYSGGVTLVGPSGVGTDGQVLASDGLGATEWIDVSGGGGSGDVVSAGVSGGQTINGGTDAGDDLTLVSTSHATKGSVYLGSTKVEVSGNAVRWLNVDTGDEPGLHFFRPGSWGVDLTIDPATGSLLYRDETSGSPVNALAVTRNGAMTVASVATNSIGLGTSITGNAFAFNANVYTGGKTDAIRFGTFRQDGAAGDVVRLAITTAVGGGDGVAEVGVRNAVLRLASLADSSAPNDSIYVSTDAGKLVYKDSGGTVNNLY